MPAEVEHHVAAEGVGVVCYRLSIVNEIRDCGHHAFSASETDSSDVGGFRPVNRHSEETIL